MNEYVSTEMLPDELLFFLIDFLSIQSRYIKRVWTHRPETSHPVFCTGMSTKQVVDLLDTTIRQLLDVANGREDADSDTQG